MFFIYISLLTHMQHHYCFHIQFMNDFTKLYLFYLLLILQIHTQIIASIDIGSGLVDTGVNIPPNFVGLSLNFSQVYLSIMNATLFQQYLTNAKVYGSSGSSFFNSLKVQSPKGYKYNCSVFSHMNVTASCIFDYSTIMTKIGTFLKNSGTVLQSSLGHDMEQANFTDGNYRTSFLLLLNSLNTATSSYISLQMVDMADQYASLGVNANYTPTNFISDMNLAYTSFSYSNFMGPGLTQTASNDWMDTFFTYQNYFVGAFTVRCISFKTAGELTVANVLNQSYYRPYLDNRFTSSNGTFSIRNIPMTITDMKMSPQNGVNGVTNGFVAAIWAIDIALEFALKGGINIYFNVDFTTSSFQSIFGPSPTFKPSSIYYGLMMLKTVEYNYPRMLIPNLIAGTSQNIKVYAFQQGVFLSILILNKDTNPNLNGTVQINSTASEEMECLYLMAPTLNETNNITFAGYSFIANNATPQGNYSSVFYQNTNGSYQVKIAYAQVAHCYLTTSAFLFVRAYDSEPTVYHIIWIVMLLFVFMIK